MIFARKWPNFTCYLPENAVRYAIIFHFYRELRSCEVHAKYKNLNHKAQKQFIVTLKQLREL